jgi:hypothetical protein
MDSETALPPTPSHYWLGVCTVIFRRGSESADPHAKKVNVLLDTPTANFDRTCLAELQRAAARTAVAKHQLPTAKLREVLIDNIIPLGMMTREQFVVEPEAFSEAPSDPAPQPEA